jgi:hypothetical protein
MAGGAWNHLPSRDTRPQPAGAGTPEGRNTRQGIPEPRAKANDAQVPEPSPENATADRPEGCKPAGQGEPGNDTQTPPEAATARTQATERAAKAPRPEPKPDAWNT